MEKQEQIKHTCKDCRYYDVFYTQSTYFFEKQKAGYCARQETATCETDNCEFYKHRPSQEKSVTIEHLDIVLADIEQLEQIFFNFDYSY